MIKTTIGLFMVVLFISFGCKKETTETKTSDISVKIDGNLWTADINTGFYDTIHNTTLIVGSNNELTEQFRIAFVGDTMGIYNFHATDFNTFGAFNYVTLMDNYTSLSGAIPKGQIVITEYDKISHTISGTIWFDGYNLDNQKKLFTEGKFKKIVYKEQ